MSLSIFLRAAPREAHPTAQGLTEYALILSLVAMTALAGLAIFGGGLGGTITTMLSDLSNSV